METFDYRQLLGGGGIEFSLTRDAMLEWKLRKTWLPLKLHKQAGGGGGGGGGGDSQKGGVGDTQRWQP